MNRELFIKLSVGAFFMATGLMPVSSADEVKDAMKSRDLEKIMDILEQVGDEEDDDSDVAPAPPSPKIKERRVVRPSEAVPRRASRVPNAPSRMEQPQQDEDVKGSDAAAEDDSIERIRRRLFDEFETSRPTPPSRPAPQPRETRKPKPASKSQSKNMTYEEYNQSKYQRDEDIVRDHLSDAVESQPQRSTSQESRKRISHDEFVRRKKASSARDEEVNKQVSQVRQEVNRSVNAGSAPKAMIGEADRFDYIGEWQDGQMHGKGTLNTKDGRSYVGTFARGKMDGSGSLSEADGTKYTGNWKRGLLVGHGSMTHADGREYIGEWMNGDMSGNGTLKHPDGWKYNGEFVSGDMEGQGTLTYNDGLEIIGTWSNGKLNGHGTMSHPAGWKYSGNWNNGVREGHGTMTYADGSRYTGEWVDGEMDGQGSLEYVNGSRYEGQFKAGKMHGQGRMIMAQ